MNTGRKHFTIRHWYITIKRFVKNFLQDILMKCFAVSFIWQFSSGLRRFCPANPTNVISDWRRAFSVWKREKKDKKAFVRFVCYTHDADRWKSIKMNTIYISPVIRPISFVSFLSLLLGFSIVIDILFISPSMIKKIIDSEVFILESFPILFGLVLGFLFIY